MQREEIMNNKIEILNNLFEEKKKELFSRMQISDLNKIIDLIEEGDKND